MRPIVYPPTPPPLMTGAPPPMTGEEDELLERAHLGVVRSCG